jgi:hypothetical protein
VKFSKFEGILRNDRKLVKGTALPFTIGTIAAEGGNIRIYVYNIVLNLSTWNLVLFCI